MPERVAEKKPHFVSVSVYRFCNNWCVTRCLPMELSWSRQRSTASSPPPHTAAIIIRDNDTLYPRRDGSVQTDDHAVRQGDQVITFYFYPSGLAAHEPWPYNFIHETSRAAHRFGCPFATSRFHSFLFLFPGILFRLVQIPFTDMCSVHRYHIVPR